MATISEKYIGDREIFTSSRGSRYIITDDGRKLYISKNNKGYGRSYKPRRGAYKRFLESQKVISQYNDTDASGAASGASE